ncbi:formate dehydrogenase accessory sulfurtransferase FdhD [Chachezhania antarctica]|mgnify:CR=1 FL=1|uniref:formate dehydrogenase accessory sulfurtransferase FdhD n=1 Tax=Chachezhania antarctica TaxID=2340860 RepID=UPI000EB5A8AA|nr:formate dehydrogenase accessory sulfurtransferase FdhD [Chachezhania antarctica]|tara:strand:- start:2943 stop:3764 length:822 start_codon:yes stop_codon:yes gene_type:complete
MAWSSTASRPCLSVQSEGALHAHRSLPEEVPVAMIYDGSSQAVMMASPGDIADLAYGFSLTEGIVTALDQIEGFETAEHELGIEARFWLRSDRREVLTARRRFMAGPVGCGLCGIDSLEAATRDLPRVSDDGPVFSRADVAQATAALRAFQPLHDQTRATHAAGFLRPGEDIVLAREDVGRHNALDKLIGAMARQGIDAADGAFVMTSRLSVELVQKCAMAGCRVLIAVSAPTAHAVRLAEGAGITLAAFARGGGFALYSHAHRVQTEVSDVA